MNVMAIGAHPDDIEFGCGGTLIKHKDKGHKVIYVCMTDTESVDATRGKVIRSESELKSETQCAADVLGVDNIFYLPFKDLHVPFSFESVSALETLIKQYNVDTIYTHWSGDSNARYVRNIYCYEQIPIPRHTDNPMRINSYTDISDSFDDKIQAAECHQSQFKKYKEAGFDVTKNLTTLAKFRGIQANCQYAEGFQVIKQVGL